MTGNPTVTLIYGRRSRGMLNRLKRDLRDIMRHPILVRRRWLATDVGQRDEAMVRRYVGAQLPSSFKAH